MMNDQVILPGRFVDWLNGTSAGQGQPDDPEVERLVAAVRAGAKRKHGRGYSVTIPRDDILPILREYAEVFYDAARDDAAWGDSFAKGEVAAARKLLGRL